MTTKKRTTRGVASPAAVTPTATRTDQDPIYTAHQVHTLAQLTFQQLAASCWMPAAGPTFGSLAGPSVNAWPGAVPMVHGCAPHPSQMLLYWYP